MKWFRRKKKEISEGPLAGPQEVLEPQVEAVSVEDAVSGPAETLESADTEESSGPSIDFVANDETNPDMEFDAAGISTSIDEADRTEPRRFFRRLRDRLHKTREHLAQRMDRLVLGKKQIDMDLLDDLEEVLITSDLGVQTTQLLLQRVADRVKRKELDDANRLRVELRQQIQDLLTIPAAPWDVRRDKPFVVMVVGVNGVGKTTTIGKLAHQWKGQGLDLMLVAGDTFRAAAIEQLCLWGERAGVPVVRQKSGSDPSAVVYDAIDAALARGVDVVLMDTAGRMHTKVNLMEEVKKVQRVITKKLPAAPHEVLLVLDATTGQNALSQARLFKQELGITGLILTKLDGTAKGGVVAAICQELQVPVRFIGIGEGIEDLQPFDPEQFASAIF
jgi:fused signal recognition particle receptor